MSLGRVTVWHPSLQLRNTPAPYGTWRYFIVTRKDFVGSQASFCTSPQIKRFRGIFQNGHHVEYQTIERMLCTTWLPNNIKHLIYTIYFPILDGGWSKFLLSANGHSSRISKITFANLSQTTCVSFASLRWKFFAKSVAKKNTFANSEQSFAGSHVGTLAAFVMENPYVDI